MNDRRFPVLWQGNRARMAALERLGCPRTVPWDFIGEVAEACLHNHDQTPERLAQRGGLAPEEMLAVRLGPLKAADRWVTWRLAADESVPALLGMLAEWERTR